MKQNKKIAITGGIGSGKSTVGKIIKDCGYPVFSCDETYSELIKDSNFLRELSSVFGDILTCDGLLDKTKLSQIVFSDKEKLNKLNSITHPAIFKKMFDDSKDLQGVCFYEVPLLFEEGNERLFDQVIVIVRDLDKRIESVVKRDNLSESQIRERINSQYNYDINNFVKYYVIHNNADFANLESQVKAVLLKLK
jgi:dephospho-CoA kinase